MGEDAVAGAGDQGALPQEGWVYSHTTGSHAHFYHPVYSGALTIAGADHIELDKGAEKKLRRQIQGK